MTLSAFGLLIVSILANLAVQFFLKLGADNLGKVNLIGFIEYSRAFATTPELLAGIAFSLISAIAYFFYSYQSIHRSGFDCNWRNFSKF